MKTMPEQPPVDDGPPDALYRRGDALTADDRQAIARYQEQQREKALREQAQPPAAPGAPRWLRTIAAALILILLGGALTLILGGRLPREEQPTQPAETSQPAVTAASSPTPVPRQLIAPAGKRAVFFRTMMTEWSLDILQQELAGEGDDTSQSDRMAAIPFVQIGENVYLPHAFNQSTELSVDPMWAEIGEPFATIEKKISQENFDVREDELSVTSNVLEPGTQLHPINDYPPERYFAALDPMIGELVIWERSLVDMTGRGMYWTPEGGRSFAFGDSLGGSSRPATVQPYTFGSVFPVPERAEIAEITLRVDRMSGLGSEGRQPMTDEASIERLVTALREAVLKPRPASGQIDPAADPVVMFIDMRLQDGMRLRFQVYDGLRFGRQQFAHPDLVPPETDWTLPEAERINAAGAGRSVYFNGYGRSAESDQRGGYGNDLRTNPLSAYIDYAGQGDLLASRQYLQTDAAFKLADGPVFDVQAGSSLWYRNASGELIRIQTYSLLRALNRLASSPSSSASTGSSRRWNKQSIELESALTTTIEHPGPIRQFRLCLDEPVILLPDGTVTYRGQNLPTRLPVLNIGSWGSRIMLQDANGLMVFEAQDLTQPLLIVNVSGILAACLSDGQIIYTTAAGTFWQGWSESSGRHISSRILRDLSSSSFDQVYGIDEEGLWRVMDNGSEVLIYPGTITSYALQSAFQPRLLVTPLIDGRPVLLQYLELDGFLALRTPVREEITLPQVIRRRPVTGPDGVSFRWRR